MRYPLSDVFGISKNPCKLKCTLQLFTWNRRSILEEIPQPLRNTYIIATVDFVKVNFPTNPLIKMKRLLTIHCETRGFGNPKTNLEDHHRGIGLNSWKITTEFLRHGPSASWKGKQQPYLEDILTMVISHLQVLILQVKSLKNLDFLKT